MLMMKRFATTLIEIASEALLLGILFVLLVVPAQEMSLSVILVSALPVVVVLFLHGYYFTRPILGMLWNDKFPIVYGACAATLYSIQMYIAFARLKQDMRPEAASKVLPLLLGGAAIVFTCALIGRLQLGKWRRRAGGPGIQENR
jgi:hypothetical protein